MHSAMLQRTWVQEVDQGCERSVRVLAGVEKVVDTAVWISHRLLYLLFRLGTRRLPD